MNPKRSEHRPFFLRTLALLACALYTWHATAQMQEVLTFEAFKELLGNHPSLRIAALSVEKGNQTLTKAKGSFDPKVSGFYQNKLFQGIDYYNHTSIKVDIPLRAPLLVTSGFENSSGAFFNPEEKTPNGGLINAGIAVPLGQGLITDNNRTELRQAKAYQRYALIEQNVLIQRLRHDAFQQYWTWWMSRQILDIHREWVAIAEQRLSDTRSRFSAGDIASIDTLETSIQVQNRKQKLQAAQAKWNKESLDLTSHLWKKNEQDYLPLESLGNTLPQRDVVYENALSNTRILADRTNRIYTTNPELLKYEPLLEQLRAEERWKKEMMKPIVNVQYNALNKATDPVDQLMTFNNYKWGAQVSWPVLMRKAKGDLGITRVKIEETELESVQKRTTLRNKALAAIQQLELLRQQFAILSSNVNSMKRLLDAEREKFNSGESSVFLINTREQQLFDLRIQETEVAAQLKLQEIEVQFLFGEL
jgi:outer membrane protein TolC